MRARLSPRDYATDQGGGKRRGIRSHPDVSARLPMCFPTRFSGKQIRLKSLISLAHPDTRPHNPQKRTLIERVRMSALCQKRTLVTSFDHFISAAGAARHAGRTASRMYRGVMGI